MTDQMNMDLGRKCGDDVSAAIRRTMLLADDRAGAMLVATYGASQGLAALAGTVAAFMGHDGELTPEFLDQVWTDVLRPLALGQLSQEARA